VRSGAINALAHLGAAAATPEILSQLLHLLKDPDEGVRGDAALALGKLASVGATLEFLVQLAPLLVANVFKEEWCPRRNSALALQQILSDRFRLFYRQRRFVIRSVAELAGRRPGDNH
jgi:hypothetical protein